MGRVDESLIAKSRSHDQDGMVKTFQKSSSPELAGQFS